MKPFRSLFLVFSSVVALAVGVFAFAYPHLLLDGKGVAAPHDAAVVWVREVGVLVFALGLVTFLVRKHGDSPTLRAFFFGSAVVHFGLFPVEIGAYQSGVITHLSGILPNSILHGVLSAGFLIFALRMKVPVPDRNA